LEMAIGCRMMPKQGIPIRAYFSASLASSQTPAGPWFATTASPLIDEVLHSAQYFCPFTVTRHDSQNGSAQAEQATLATTAACLMQFIDPPSEPPPGCPGQGDYIPTNQD